MNHYQILQVDAQATAIQIKQAYRKLAKIYHPDTRAAHVNQEAIIQINAAYEILSNPQARRRYDQELKLGTSYASVTARQARTAKASQEYSRRRQAANKQEISYQKWLEIGYEPSDRYIQKIIKPLKLEIDNLAADPFDDQLLEEFQTYLEDCHQYLQLAKQRFAAYPNPPQLAKVAANLYYCLNHLEDGIKELEYFVFNYDDHYLHAGQEFFRIAERLRSEAEIDIRLFS